MSGPAISVIIPTHGRAELLRASLESLSRQSLPADRYEVIVVDDGSPDATAEVCRELHTRMPLRYFRIEHSGIAAAKNLGIFASSAPILLFFDDDDYASPTLLEEHVDAHRRFAKETIAILGYTAWAPTLRVTEVMHYVMDVGRLLFCYNMSNGKRLDFTYFWGGRSSCKRSFLIRHGVFCQAFEFGSEDVELGYRLAPRGLEVIYCREIVQYMNRGLTYDEYCRRSWRQGKSQVQFARLYPGDPVVQEYCQVAGAEQKWRNMAAELDRRAQRVRELEATAGKSNDGKEERRQELHELYRWTFQGFKIKGIVEAIGSDRQSAASAMPITVG